MIILEGPDGTGKTTLAQIISERYGDIPVHAIGRSPGTSQGVIEFMETCFDRCFELCVQDRVTQISEQVYSRVFDRQLVPPTVFNYQTARLLEVCSPIIVYCRVDDLTKVTHTQEEYDDACYHEQVTSEMSRIRYLYDELFASELFETADVIPFDYTQENALEFIDVYLYARIPRPARVRPIIRSSRSEDSGAGKLSVDAGSQGKTY